MIKSARIVLAGAALAFAAGSAFAAPDKTPAKTGALICPVMKGEIKDKAKAPKLFVNNEAVYLCCAGCPDMVKKDPAKYLTTAVKDPVSGKSFKISAKSPKVEKDGALFLFSSPQTQATFEKDPAKYIKPAKV